MPFIHRVIPEGSEVNFDHLMQGYWQEAINNNITVIYFLATAGMNEDGISWCPDCRLGAPLVYHSLADKNAYLVESMIARSAWKNVPDHPYKTHPVLQTPRLPTLYKWADGKILGKLVEGEVYDKPKLAQFLGIELNEVKDH